MLSSITVIGAAGRTGQLFVNEIAKKNKDIRIEAVIRKKDNLIKLFPDSVSVSSDIRASLKRGSELIILAIPNPTEEVLEIIAQSVKKPVTIILPQNGISVVPAAEKIFKEINFCNIYLIRASLFTTVNLNKNGKANYNADKLRIAFSPVKDSPTRIKILDVKELFVKTGFDVAIFDNFRSMEMTKLIINGLGSTAAITGYSSKETFRDKRLFELEMRALKDRFTIMRVEGIQFAKIPWKNISLLPLAQSIPTPILKKARGVIGELISKGRENIPPSASEKISEGKITELIYYHSPFLDLAKLHGLTSPVDEAILEVITEHEKGLVNLAALTKEQRRDILLKAYQTSLQKPYTSRDPLKTLIVEKLLLFFSKDLNVSGIENLEEVRENLKSHRSVVILANHLSHADHPTLAVAMRQNGYPDLAERLTFVAGMHFKDEFLAKIFNNAYARILVSTPTTAPQTEEENKEAQRINLKGFFETSRLLNKGNLLVIYPEGTRSRKKKLLKAIPTVARYLENPNVSIILPVGIEGTGDLLPVGRKILRFRKTKISFGKPILPPKLFNDILEELPLKKRSNYKSDKNIREKVNEKIIDFVMKKISQLLPAEQRGAYK